VELDLSSNWFGMQGLANFKSAFAQFQQLRRLNLSNNKLCAEEGNETKHLREIFLSVASTLETLQIAENSICDAEMTEFLQLPISSMPRLKSLDLSRNPLTGNSIVSLYAEIVKSEYPLENLNITGCQLMNHGLAELLREVEQPGSCITYLNLTACRLTE